MLLTDTHCHLGRYRRRADVLAATRGRVGVVVATSRPSEARDLLALLGAEPGLEIGVGCHPELAGSVYLAEELAVLEEIAGSTGWVSEIGLDGVIAGSVGPEFGNAPTLDAQILLMEQVLSIVGAERLFSVHSRGAERQTIDVLEAHGVRAAVLHGFGGARDDARRALDLGYAFSVGPSALETPQGRDLLAWLPLDAVLLETDGPYGQWRSHPVRPHDCIDIARAVAAELGRAPDAVAHAAEQNLRRLRTGLPAVNTDRTWNA